MSSPATWASPTVATGDVHAHHERRTALQDALVAIRCRTSLDGCEPERRGNHESVLLAAGSDARPPPRATPSTAAAEIAAGLRFDLTQELGYRYPDFSDGFETPDGQLREVCERAFEDRYNGSPDRNRARGAIARRARSHRRAQAGRLLPAPLGGARARARGRGRGARPGLAPARAAAGPGERLVGRLDRLLPDRAVPCRPGRSRPLDRPVPEPRARLRARHRPRLPARHPREADRRRHRALRPGARQPRRRVLDLPLARRDPRPRQGARPAVRRARAARPRHRGQPAPRRGGGRAPPGRPRLRRAGARSASSRTRSAACRGTSRSTRAGW